MKHPVHAIVAAFLLAALPVTAQAQEARSAPGAADVQIDARSFLPSAPGANSPTEAADRSVVRGPWPQPRIAQAREDDVIDPFAAFDSVLGAEFRANRLPQTTALLTRVARAAGYASSPPKDLYRRTRPFVADPALPTCITPTDALRTSYAYPSGHASIGWAWALVLAELEPSFADALFLRGREFGDSRVVCGLHWPSDVEAGRLIGAAAVARLHADGTFTTQLQATRAELDAVTSAPR